MNKSDIFQFKLVRRGFQSQFECFCQKTNFLYFFFFFNKSKYLYLHWLRLVPYNWRELTKVNYRRLCFFSLFAVACKNFFFCFFSKLSFFFYLVSPPLPPPSPLPFLPPPSVPGRSWQGRGRAGWAEQWECGAGIVGENLGWSHSVWSAPPLPSSSFCSAAKAISTSYWHQQ